MAATMRIPTEFTAVDKFTSVVSKMASGVSNFSKSAISAVNRVNTKVNSLWSSLDGISQLGIGVGVAGLFTMASSAIMDYETALASLEAVTGESASTFKTQIEDIAKSTNKSAIEVAGAFEIIGSAMSQYLSDPRALGEITQAGIMLSEAAKMDLEPALESLTSAMNQFNLGAEKATDTVNRLTAGEIVGSVSTAKATEQLSKFGAVANSINVTLPESVALIQTLGKKFTGSMQSEIGTAAKNMLLIMDASSTASKAASLAMQRNGVDTKVLMDRTIPLGDRLKELSKIQKDGAAMALVFGKENAAAGSVIFNELDTYVKWEEKIRTTNEAQKQATVNTNTLAKGLEAIKNAFTNTVVAGEQMNGTMSFLRDLAFMVANNMGTVITVLVAVLGAFMAFKVVVGILKAISIAQGIYTAVMAAYSAVAVTAALTGASFAAVLWATLAPVLAVVSAITAIIAIFYYWDEIVAWFSKQWETFTNWISSLWNDLVLFFQEFSFVDFFISIGQAIINYMLLPLKGVLKLVSMIPGGIGEAAQAGLDKLNEMSNLSVMLGKENTQVESPEVVNAQNSRANTLNGNINMTVNDKNNNIGSIQTDFGGIGVNTTKTQGAF